MSAGDWFNDLLKHLNRFKANNLQSIQVFCVDLVEFLLKNNHQVSSASRNMRFCPAAPVMGARPAGGFC